MLTAQKLLISVAPNITQSIICVKAADRHVSEAKRGCFQMIFKEKNLKEKKCHSDAYFPKSRYMIGSQCTFIAWDMFIGVRGYHIDFLRVFTSNFNIEKQDPIKLASQQCKLVEAAQKLLISFAPNTTKISKMC